MSNFSKKIPIYIYKKRDVTIQTSLFLYINLEDWISFRSHKWGLFFPDRRNISTVSTDRMKIYVVLSLCIRLIMIPLIYVIMSRCRNHIATSSTTATTITAPDCGTSIGSTGCTDTFSNNTSLMDLIYLIFSLTQIRSTIVTDCCAVIIYFITSTRNRYVFCIMPIFDMRMDMLAGYRCCRRCRSRLGSCRSFGSRGSCCLWSSRTLRLFCCSRLCRSCYRCSLCTRLCSALRFCSCLRCLSRLRSLGCLGVRCCSSLCICLCLRLCFGLCICFGLSSRFYRCSLLFIYGAEYYLFIIRSRIFHRFASSYYGSFCRSIGIFISTTSSHGNHGSN